MLIKPKENKKICFESDGFWFDGYYRNKRFVYAKDERRSESAKDVTKWEYGFVEDKLPKNKEKIIFVIDNKKYKGIYKNQLFISEDITASKVDNWWGINAIENWH